MEYPLLHKKVIEILAMDQSIDQKLLSVCELLKNGIPYYHWVGFYFVNGEKKELKLRQFAGKPTEHTVIPFGKGICGQVAVSNKNFIVQDISEQDNYISCGMDVKSEIVIPIFKDGKNVGQIDIDSHTVAPFTEEDETFLELVCKEISSLPL